MMIKPELFKMAYKKLKSSLYYDKTQSIARDKLVEFEAKNKDIDAYIEKFALAVLSEKKRSIPYISSLVLNYCYFLSLQSPQ